MRRWIWAELIAFDVEAADFGLAAYFERAGFVPEAILLFLFNPEFVHTHAGLAEDRTLPADCCSYGAHPFGYDRPRQTWTTHRLRDLVAELRARGVDTLLSVMDLFGEDPWLAGQPSLWHIDVFGQRVRSVCPYHRLADGTPYEQFFGAQCTRALADYGFAGLHLADGLSHPRLPLYWGEFTGTTMADFVAWGGELPDELGAAQEDTPERLAQRRDWLWAHAARRWIDFYAERNVRFVRAVAERIHQAGGVVWANNAMSRDPLEALYRYGVDYGRLAQHVDGFIAETVAPAVELGGEGGRVAPLFDQIQATLLQFSVTVALKPVVALCGVHDANEQYDALRHGAARIERDVTERGNLWRQAHGGLVRCSDGELVCLGDGLAEHEWAWLRQWWSRAYDLAPGQPQSATFIWSPASLGTELNEYLAHQVPSSRRLLDLLLAAGAPLRVIATPAQAAAAPGPLVVINPAYLPSTELRLLLESPNPPQFWIGAVPTGVTLPGTVQTLESVGGGDVEGTRWPGAYFEPLAMREIDERALHDVAEALCKAIGGPRVTVGAGVRVQSIRRPGGLRRLLVSNDSPGYVPAQVDLGVAVREVRVVGDFPKTPPSPVSTGFGIKVPPHGVSVLDAVVEGD